MWATRATSIATRRVASQTQQQKRGIINWLVNYPDKVMETKAVQMRGGVCQGEKNPTWLKQPNDIMVSAFAGFCTVSALLMVLKGHYNMAYGVNKKE